MYENVYMFIYFSDLGAQSISHECILNTRIVRQDYIFLRREQFIQADGVEKWKLDKNVTQKDLYKIEFQFSI